MKRNTFYEVCLHWLLTMVGGFMGAYAILLHSGNFASAETGNLIELTIELSNAEYNQVGIRLGAVIVFGFSIVLSYLLTNYSKLNLWKLVLWVDAICLSTTALLPKSTDPLLSLYPIFFCTAFQWGTYSSAASFSSSSLFITNNFKQALLGWTQYILTKNSEFRQKACFYSVTIFSFLIGAAIATTSVKYFSYHAAFFMLIPLMTARILLIFSPQLGKGGDSPEEEALEAEEELGEAIILEEKEDETQH